MGSSALQAALETYDGKHVAVLERARDELPVGDAMMREAILLAAHERSATAAGATWLLRAWLEAGWTFGARLVAELARQLPHITDQWAQLHVCQAMRKIEVPKSSAAAFADFFESCRCGPRPLVRAWAMDALHRLALDHPACELLARRALEQGLDDPAASVRARVRRIQRGD